MSHGTSVHAVNKTRSPRLYENVVFPFVTKTWQLTVSPVKFWKHLVRGHGWKNAVVRLSILAALALCGGLMLAHAQKLPSYIPKVHPQTILSPAASKKQSHTVVQGPSQSDSQFASYPTWAQNFASYNTSQLDNHYWEASVGPAQNSNNEAEYYTDKSENLRIENGALILEATHQQEPDGYAYASARVDTEGKKTFLYGRIDITAKLPSGIGTWPAVWLLPANNKYENLSPISDVERYKNGGEIDLIEAVGFEQNVEYGVVHTTTDLSRPGGIGEYNDVTIPDNNTAYNVYSLLWSPTSITFEVNNKPFYTYTKTAGANYTTWPFNQPFYLILNLALGGSWGGQDTAAYPGNGVDNSALPASLAIQSIYYYPYVGNTANK